MGSTVVSQITTVAPSPEAAPEIAHVTKPIRITDVKDEDLERTTTNVEPFDRVLGGGLVTASVIVLGGDPGAGKSSLVARVLADLGKRVLYATGEETIEKVTIRARRIGAAHPEIWIFSSNDIDEVIAHASKLEPAVLAVDSIQVMTCSDAGGAPGSMAQVRECTSRLAQFANREGIAVIIIGHVTKDGSLAGPNTLKHLVDVVLSLEASEFGNHRTLRASKNRFGDTQEIGKFRMCADGMVPADPDELQDEIDREHEIENHEREAADLIADDTEARKEA